MGMMFWFIMGCVAVALTYLYFSKSKWVHWWRTKVNQADERAKQLDPAGQMRQKVLDAAKDLGQVDHALAESKAYQAKLKRLIVADERTEAQARAQIKNLVENGANDDDPSVLSLLRTVQSVSRAIATNKAELSNAENQYKALLASANKTQAIVRDKLAAADRMGMQLKLGEQGERVRQMLSRYDPSAPESALAGIDEYEQAAQEKLDMYSARAEVATDRGHSSPVVESTPATDPALADLLQDIKGRG